MFVPCAAAIGGDAGAAALVTVVVGFGRLSGEEAIVVAASAGVATGAGGVTDFGADFVAAIESPLGRRTGNGVTGSALAALRIQSDGLGVAIRMADSTNSPSDESFKPRPTYH